MLLVFTTVRIDGRDCALVPAEDTPPSTGWARAVIDDPQQQHVVHLLAASLLALPPGCSWADAMVELEAVLESHFRAVPIDLTNDGVRAA